jgi:hypothetical protein
MEQNAYRISIGSEGVELIAKTNTCGEQQSGWLPLSQTSSFMLKALIFMAL